MFKHMSYPHSRKSLSASSEDGSQKNGTRGNGTLSSDTCSSRSSSALSSAGGEAQTGVIKVHCNILRPDVDYKTLFVSNYTSTKDVVQMLLRKCKMRNRDPNLYYLMMEISMNCQSGQPLLTVLELDDDAQPLDLQTCQPSGYRIKFTLMCREGGLLKVHDTCLNPSSKYKSLLIAQHTLAEEVVQLLLNCHDSMESSDNFALFEVCHMPHYYEHKLHPHDMPLLLERDQWPHATSCTFHLRPIVPSVTEGHRPPFVSQQSAPEERMQAPELPLKDTRLSESQKESYLRDRPPSFFYGENPFSAYQNYVYI
ncbi:hypothetical protein BV898_02430 [Hypsibius exemplaris]|uniref:Ras-associating domain-containing protein n=1 Tax=Hypsibius exemplaris TaxID=2072580 RepID=A0A1W0X862_HYPEX|nr:hypothetical protein BV898_02430 [Hypsibius exemplaris]